MTRILITGATGFIGRHCLAALAGAGELHAASRSPRPADGSVTWHSADLLDDASITALLRTVRPTHLLHAAWEATPVSYATSPENLRWLRAGVTLLQAFGDNGGERFLGVGTSAEYARSETPCIEEVTPIRPETIYGHAKAAMHQATCAAARHHGFAAAWARIFLPFGPGDPAGRLLPSVLAAIRRGERVALSDGLQQRDFVYAPDAGRMLARLLLSDGTGSFNIGSGAARSIRDVVGTLARLHDAETLIDFGVKPRREGEAEVLVADVTRYVRLIGALEATPLETALRALSAQA